MRHSLYGCVTVAAILALATPAVGQAPRNATVAPVSTAARTIATAALQGPAPVLDGRLDDAAWVMAPAQQGFVQRQPAPGAAATLPTEVRVLHDGDALYVGMRMHDDRPDSISAPLTRRDAGATYSDWAYVMLDSYADGRTAFIFAVNPRGVQKDYAVYDDAREDLSWDAVWQVVARTDSAGWTAEFRIPLSQLRFNPGRDGWGVNFQRRVARRDEWSFWSPWPPNSPGYVSSFGELTGLSGLSAPRHLEIQPYSVARLTRAPSASADPFDGGGGLMGTMGADLRYGMTSDVTLTATVNPDFGQVEADPSEVNLSAFETFLAEQRPFFVEGADIFRFSVDGSEQLFYSRRIGRAPQGGVPGGAEFTDVPTVSTILGAAKVTGKLAGGWTMGVLNALTSREEAPWAAEGGAITRQEVEPLTNYAAGRLIRSYNGGRSALGLMGTSTNRFLSDPALSFLPSSAYSGGLHARHRFGGGAYEASGWIVGSRVSGDTAALQRVQRSSAHYFQRPDSHTPYDPALTSLSGTGGFLSLSRIGGGNWRWGATGQVRSPGLELNDLGYLREAGLYKQAAFVGYRQSRSGPVVRSWNAYVNQYSKTTWGGERTLAGMNANGTVIFRNLWAAYASLEHDLAVVSPEALRGGPALARPAQSIANWAFNTDQRRKLMLDVSGRVAMEHEGNGRAASVSPGMVYRPSGRMDLSLSPEYSWLRNSWQYAATASTAQGPRYVVGTLEQNTLSLTARFNYTFSPALSLQFYAQPFVSTGTFSDYREVQDAGARGFDDRFHLLAPGEVTADPVARTFAVDRNGDGTAEYTFGARDFSRADLLSNAVLRWEYRPGSTLFVVWSQTRSGIDPVGDIGLGRELDRLADLQPTNVLLIKLSYWLNW